jgi:tartrate-resistant acid phosphatase type 5
MLRYTGSIIIIAFILLTGFTAQSVLAGNPPKAAGAPVNVQADSITFAVIGDYGRDSKQEDSVANMIKSWNPGFIITMGDNNYLTGSASTIKNNIGKYYGDYIYNPDAKPDWQCHGKAAQQKQNRFFPAPGNHDNYSIPPLKPYLDYFTLPGDEKNYDFTWGPVHFYSLNTGKSAKNKSENLKQSAWLHEALQKDTKTFKIVYFHHPPFSAGHHGSSKDMRWPYKEWGVDAVLTGHEHFYAHATVKGSSQPLYLICGNSGSNEHYPCNEHPLDKDKYDWLCDNVHFGAIKVTVTAHKAVFEYYAVEEPNAPLDVNVIRK